MDDPLIDSHAHVWDRACAFVPGARYHPEYEATIDTYLGVLDAHGIARAVLVQPSFLGTDNSYLLASLRAHPDRLRGIVVLEPTTTQTELDDLTALGVIGARFNLIGRDPKAIAAPSGSRHIEAIAQQGWWVEVQANGPDWPMLLDVLTGCGARIMVDHFGKPAGSNCPGHKALIAADSAKLCVKLSAPYRQIPADMVPYARAFLEAWGPQRCLWGSDWPWTQHETRHSYADTMRWQAGWTTADQRAEMSCAAPTLCGF